MGWTIDELASGAKAYRWNSIEKLLDGPAVWGMDYTIVKDGTPLNYRPETNQLFASDDVLMARDITLDVVRTSNPASGYLFILILIHLFHLALGLAYRLVNGIRILKGSIHPGDSHGRRTTLLVDPLNNLALGTSTGVLGGLTPAEELEGGVALDFVLLG